MSRVRTLLLLATIASTNLLLAGCQNKPTHQTLHPVTQHPITHWSYEGKTGPKHWGSLSPEYAICSTGKEQSPINIASTKQQDLVNISFFYQPVPLSVTNTGHSVQVNYPAGSYIEIDGTRFDLLQFHFHSPSEHTINGKQAAAEMHLVHKSAAGGLAVVGVMIEAGDHNASVDPVWSNIPSEEGKTEPTSSTVNALSLLPEDRRTTRYDGSLTTPPGTQGVKWNLMTQPITVSKEQIAQFRKAYFGNNRPTQPLNGRVVIQDSSR